MPIVTIAAKIVAKPAAVEKVKGELLKLVGPTRKEPGCIEYNLHQDKSDPAQFLFYELGKSAEDLQKHMQSEHFKRFQSVLADSLETVAVQKLTRLEPEA